MNKTDQQTAALRQVQEAGFTLHELVLYLDTHPNNAKALSMYQTYRKKYAELVARYEAAYGPLTAHGVSGDRWTWGAQRWPWQTCEGGDRRVDV